MKKKLFGITEISKKLDLVDKNNKPLNHIIRFWEKNFSQIKPTLLSGKRRFYNNKDLDLLKLIKFLLKDQGYTINGVKKILNKKINSLDHYKTSSIKDEYIKKNLKLKSNIILEKIKNLKKNNG